MRESVKAQLAKRTKKKAEAKAAEQELSDQSSGCGWGIGKCLLDGYSVSGWLSHCITLNSNLFFPFN